MSEAKEFYCKHVWQDAPLFHQPWWLDVVAGDEWDCCVLKDGNLLKAYYLYAVKKDLAGFHIIMPQLTQFLGPNFRINETSPRKRLNMETEILEELVKQLPEAASFDSRWHFRFQNWLPFYWNKFLQTTRYTYFINDISNVEALRESFSEKIRREISKAENQFILVKAEDVNLFYQLLKKNFLGKEMKVPFGKKLLENIFAACAANKAGEIYLAKSSDGRIAAGIFVAFDATTAYYLIGGKDDDFGNSGAMSFLFWNAFKELGQRVRSFDFEGSMIKGVENYFRSFGAEQKGFFQLSKMDSTLAKLKSGIRRVIKR